MIEFLQCFNPIKIRLDTDIEVEQSAPLYFYPCTTAHTSKPQSTEDSILEASKGNGGKQAVYPVSCSTLAEVTEIP